MNSCLKSVQLQWQDEAKGKQTELKDSSPTVRLPCNLENKRTIVEYISSDRAGLGRLTDSDWQDEKHRQVLSTGEIKSFALHSPSTNSNLIPSPGLAKNLFKSHVHTHTHTHTHTHHSTGRQRERERERERRRERQSVRRREKVRTSYPLSAVPP